MTPVRDDTGKIEQEQLWILRPFTKNLTLYVEAERAYFDQRTFFERTWMFAPLAPKLGRNHSVKSYHLVYAMSSHMEIIEKEYLQDISEVLDSFTDSLPNLERLVFQVEGLYTWIPSIRDWNAFINAIFALLKKMKVKQKVLVVPMDGRLQQTALLASVVLNALPARDEGDLKASNNTVVLPGKYTL